MPQDAAPLEGHALCRTDDLDDARARVAAVLNPHLPTTMIWAESAWQVVIQIDR